MEAQKDMMKEGGAIDTATKEKVKAIMNRKEKGTEKGKAKGKAIAKQVAPAVNVQKDWQEILSPLRSAFHILLQDDGIVRSAKELADCKKGINDLYKKVTNELTMTKRCLPAKMVRKAQALGLSLEGVKVNAKKIG
jgi:hypothetical protein